MNPQRYSHEDIQYTNMQVGMNAMLKSGLTQNIIFQTCTTTPKSICSKYVHLCFFLLYVVKILECEVFPEFIILSLDMESHSFSICLRITNHNICDKSMLHINLHKLQRENKENLYSSYLL